MRNKNIIQNKIERIESYISKLNFSIGVLDRRDSYTSLDQIKDLISQIKTYLNTEEQD